MVKLIGARYQIQGIVQGVGFRPFVYNLANTLGISGWVKNTSSGVEIEVDGSAIAIEEFSNRLRSETPPLAQIDDFQVTIKNPNGYTDFQIYHSEAIPQAFQPISPDVSICQDCLNELFDPNDRRFLYPFINCTNCGPRFTIIRDIPYDRPLTTMAEFPMCAACEKEYRDPTNRRFHAQPIACPDCGPQIWLEDSSKISLADGLLAIRKFQEKIHAGEILAVKGIGGFHLACDALNHEAVERLRSRKQRVDKPFALMLPDLQSIEKHCYLTTKEIELLTSRERPIVLLKRKETSNLPIDIAPGQNTLGIMLPYSPLHYLFFLKDNRKDDDLIQALVMTSGNISEEPIATENEEAVERLTGLADAFLMHNRPIYSRCDDSVLRVLPIINNKDLPMSTTQTEIYHLRRSRGYAPFPFRTNWNSPSILACGPELKNTFCLSKGPYSFLSHHVGDLENYETLKSFEDSIDHYQRLFKINPEIIVYDLHPDYLSTRYALSRAQKENLKAVGIQHHHAHIASCMTDNRLPDDCQVIGVSFDGTGYGTDGAIWGGEILLSTFTSFTRIAHLKYAPLPGGDRAIREPWRMALSWLYVSDIEWQKEFPPVQFLTSKGIHQDIFTEILRHKTNSPDTSSMGRLFDAVASLAGIKQAVNYEAQAAIELETLLDPTEKASYKFELNQEKNNSNIIIDPKPLFTELVTDITNKLPVQIISAKFHRGVSNLVLEICCQVRNYYGLKDVILSGGVWQNMFLLKTTRSILSKEGFTVWTHSTVPTNDGGVSLGQAAIAAHHLNQ